MELILSAGIFVLAAGGLALGLVLTGKPPRRACDGLPCRGATRCDGCPRRAEAGDG